MNENTGVVLTGTQVDAFADNMALRAIATELLTGMQLTGHVTGLEALRRRGLIEGRTTKKAGLRKAVTQMKNRYEGWEPTGMVAKALAKK